jgi:hypothetical protein
MRTPLITSVIRTLPAFFVDLRVEPTF